MTKPTFVKFPSIEQYRNVVKNVKDRARYAGKDENGNVIFKNDVVYPTIKFMSTVKLHGCFEKNTLVTLANGENEKISNLQTGTYILTYNTKTNKQEIKQILNVINKNLVKEWCKLTFDNNKELICTKDHKIYTKNRGYIEAQYLTSDDEFELLN